VFNAYLHIAGGAKNIEVRIFPGVRHGYMMHSNEAAFSPSAREAPIACALKILDGLQMVSAGGNQDAV
jgi:hypothetical protein